MSHLNNAAKAVPLASVQADSTENLYQECNHPCSQDTTTKLIGLVSLESDYERLTRTFEAIAGIKSSEAKAIGIFALWQVEQGGER